MYMFGMQRQLFRCIWTHSCMHDCEWDWDCACVHACLQAALVSCLAFTIGAALPLLAGFFIMGEMEVRMGAA